MADVIPIKAEEMPYAETYALLGILQQHAPSGGWQAWLAQQYNAARAKQTESDFVIRTLAAGILFGNWPWTAKPKVDPKTGKPVAVDKLTAIERLEKANFLAAAATLRDYKNKDGNDWGWDGHIRSRHPDVVSIIWA